MTAGRILWGGSAFVAAATTVATAGGMALGGLSVWSSITSLIVGLIVAILAARSVDDRPQPVSAADAILLAVFGLLCLRAFIWVVYVVDDEIRVLSPNNVGDASIHLTFIRYLANGIPFWPQSPLLEGTPLAYPVGTDLFNALLELCGVPTIRGLVWVGLWMSLLTAIALWRWGGAFAIACFLFNGGLAGFAFFASGLLEDFQAELGWKNIFLSVFVTQRSLLYAIPAGLALLISWRSRITGNGLRAPLWAEVLLYGTLPLFSVHTFLFFSLLLAAGVFVGALRWHAIRLAVAALIPGALSMMLSTAFFSMPSHIRWQPGWMQGDNPAWFWIQNFGLALPLCAWLAVKLIPRRTPSDSSATAARYFVWTSCALFAVGITVMLSPWEWDNMKVLLWSWIIVAPFLWTEVLTPRSLGARVGLCAVLFASGAISVLGGIDGRHGYRIASRKELDRAAWVVKDIPPTDRFAVDPQYNHPLLLIGRPVSAGYEGHLWSHGLDYKRVYAAQKALFETGDLQTAAAALPGTKWIFFGDAERRDFPASPLAAPETKVMPLRP